MNSNQSNQFKSKPKIKIAFASLIFGILSILADASILISPKLYELLHKLYLQFPLKIYSILFMAWYYFSGFSFYGGMLLFPIIGLILGIMSRKSKLAIVGIILSIIGLIGGVYLTLFLFRLFQQ